MIDINNIIGQIYSSDEYDKFKLHEWNRTINQKHLDDLERSIKKYEFNNPILVNQDFIILDGQHRFLALKKLKKNISYIIQDTNKTEKKEIIKTLNSYSKNWKLFDYVEAYAKIGDKNYQSILSLQNKYPNISKRICIFLLQDSSRCEKGVNDQYIKDGKFKVKDHDKAIKFAQQISNFEFIGFYSSGRFQRSLQICMNNKEYDHQRMLHKMKKFQSLLLLQPNQFNVFSDKYLLIFFII